MIKNRQDYREYLAEDEKALNLSSARLLIKMLDPIWKYQRSLRRHEYYANCCKKPWQRPFAVYAALRHRHYGIKYGISIPVNVFGKGLNIAHIGTIIVNSHARIGDYCRLHAGTNIGTAAGQLEAAPAIGNRVYIGPGAKIFGKIQIADGIVIGANAVVNKDFTEEEISIAGVPAKKISDKGSQGLLYAPKP